MEAPVTTTTRPVMSTSFAEAMRCLYSGASGEVKSAE